MKATLKDIKTTIRKHFPQKVVYMKGVPVRKGHGRASRKYPRTLGSSLDRLFSIEIIGWKRKVGWLKFMTPASGPAMTRTLTAVQGIVTELYPDWSDGAWLRETAGSLVDGDTRQQGVIQLDRVEFAGHDVGVLFISVK